MKITDVTTTLLRQPGAPGIQDATIRHRDSGRSALFVHIRTDAGYEGGHTCHTGQRMQDVDRPHDVEPLSEPARPRRLSIQVETACWVPCSQ